MSDLDRRSAMALIGAVVGIGTTASARAKGTDYGTLRAMASTGASLSLNADEYDYTTLRGIVGTTIDNGGSVILRNAGSLDYSSLRAFARKGVLLEF